MTFNLNGWKRTRYANRAPEEVERDKEYRRKYYLAHRAKAKAKSTAYRAENKEAIKLYREATRERDKLRRLCKTHGITEAYALKLLETEYCPICGVELAWNGQAANSLVIDHCHESGAVRGAICGNCNKMLGFARDKPDILLKAIDYLSTAIQEES